MIGLNAPFLVTIINRCMVAKIDAQPPIPDLLYILGSPQSTSLTLAPFPDDVSRTTGNLDGFTYCGPRIYTVRLVEIGTFYD